MPLLGFLNFLAPINKTQKVWDQVLNDSPQGGNVYKLPWGQDARTKLAPSLYGVIRQGLESQKMQDADIKSYFASLKSLSRYDLSFKKLYVTLQDMGVDPPPG